jgi:hypothetical protein
MATTTRTARNSKMRFDFMVRDRFEGGQVGPLALNVGSATYPPVC